MGNWQKVRLGDICLLNYGKGLTATKRIAGDIPVYSSAGITGSHNECLIDSKGIIVGRKGTVGSVYFSEVPFFCIDTAYYILPNDDKYNFKYLYYRLKSLNLDKLNEDSAVPGLNRETAYNQEFFLPPLAEQERIAAILGSLDDKIELNNRINKNLEEQAQALFKRWFVDFEFPDENGQPYKSSGGAMKESELGEIPEDWTISRLDQVAELIAGGDKPKDATLIPTDDCQIPIYSNGISNEGLYGYTNNARIKEESITVSARGTIGYTCLRMKPYLPIVRLIAITPNKDIVSAKFLYHWLLSQNISGTGTTQQQLTVPDFKKSQVLQPTVNVVCRFTDVVNPIYAKIEMNKEQNQTIAQVRDSLLRKLMSNQISVEFK